MIREILVVSADSQYYQRIENACRYTFPDGFSFTHVHSTKAAADRLRSHSIALVLMGQLPKEESIIAFLFYIWHSFPGIPVLNNTGEQEFPESLMIEETGITFRFGHTLLPMKQWPSVIDNALKREQEGGYLFVNDVANLAQMIENETRTCTLRIIDHTDSRHGILFFEKGKLKNARLKTVQGEIAAYAILSWEHVKVRIQDSCDISSSKIRSNLQALLIESQVKKDNEEKPHSDSSSWIDAAQEEKNNYQKLLDNYVIPEIYDSSEEVPEVSEPSPSGMVKLMHHPMTTGIAIGLALFMTLAYLLKSYIDYVADNGHVTPKPVVTNSISAPKSVSTPEEIPNKTDAGNITKPEKPADALTPESSQPTQLKEEIDQGPNNVSSNRRKNEAAIDPADDQISSLTPAVETDEPPITTDGSKPEQIPDTAKVEAPPSVEKPVQPELAPRQPLYSVYLHYSNTENRLLAYRLAARLMTSNVNVPKIDHARYKQNDIRFFHSVDEKLAIALQAQVLDFLEDRFPHKSGIHFKTKNLSEKYPHVPQGQLEIWLNLPVN